MSVKYKSRREIEKIRKSAQFLSLLHGEIAKWVKEGITTLFLDKIASEFINDHQAISSFLNYDGYPASICTSVNAQVVHGLPTKYQLRSGDILSVDAGVYLDGFHSDCAYTYPIGEVSAQDKLLWALSKQK
jgi:methionyl aminopeptidase